MRVSVLLEEHPYGGEPNLKQVLAKLVAAYIDVKASSPAFALTHEKAIVIDNKIALIMTLNQAQSSFTKNREYGINTNPDDVLEVANVFASDWNQTTPILSDPRLVWSPVNAYLRLVFLIDNAKKTLDIENEEMQDAQVENHLISAEKRGVSVRVVLPKGTGKNDPNAAGVKSIEAGGVQVNEIMSPQSAVRS